MKKFQLDYLWSRLQYAYYEWRNKIRVSRFNETILVKYITRDFNQKIDEYNWSESNERHRNAERYYASNKVGNGIKYSMDEKGELVKEYL